MKKTYIGPSLVVIGRITALTGMVKNLNYLDNTNGSDAWKNMPLEVE
jgi:hypothetical protein